MNAGTPSDDAILTRLARGLRNAQIPAAGCPACGKNCAVLPVPGFPMRQSFGGVADYTFGVCRHCSEVCGLVYSLESLDGDLSARAYRFPRPLASIGSPAQQPTLSADDIVVPPYLPRPVDALFRQARHNLVLRNWDAAGMTYRKTLEVALCTKFGFRRKTLASMVEAVSKSQPLTLKLFAWLTRVAGNNAAHAAGFSEAAAGLLDSHVEQLVVYLFTVPEVRTRAAR